MLAGGRRVLDTHGWQGATLERTAAEAGISRVTLHRRGVTKEAILASLAHEAAESYRQRQTGSITSRTRRAGSYRRDQRDDVAYVPISDAM